LNALYWPRETPTGVGGDYRACCALHSNRMTLDEQVMARGIAMHCAFAEAVLSGALNTEPADARAVQWIPPRWDWVDPLKDIQAQVLAMEAGITSRRKVVEGTGYDIEEVDRENAADAKRASDLGLTYRASPGETQGARATPTQVPETNSNVGPSDFSRANNPEEE
jgi:capsid protein